MWKKLISLLLVILATGVVGHFLGRLASNKTIEPEESVIDSLEALKVSYESITDSLFLLRSENDSLREAKVREVTKYKVIESVRYITENTRIDTIQITVNPTDTTDTVAVMREKDLQVINGVIAENIGLKERIQIDDSIISVMSKNLAVTDTLLVIKDQQLVFEKGKTKKARRKYFLRGLGVGASLMTILWMLL